MLSPKEQFENAVNNYKPNSRYNGLSSFPVFMFGENQNIGEKVKSIIKWSEMINEYELANYLVDCVNAYEDIQFELDYQISEYETEPTTKGAEKAANKINALCHALKRSAREYLPDRDVDFERERLLGIN